MVFFLQWLAKTFLIALLQKELICTNVKEKFEEACKTKSIQYHKFKLNLWSLVRNVGIPLCLSNHVCDVVVANWICQDRFISPIPIFHLAIFAISQLSVFEQNFVNKLKILNIVSKTSLVLPSDIYSIWMLFNV